MKDTRYLTFALCKGRLAKQTLELLEELGITCEEMKDKNSRKLIFVNEELKLSLWCIHILNGKIKVNLDIICDKAHFKFIRA